MLRSRVCYCVLCPLIGLALALLFLFRAPPVSVAQQPAKKGPISFIGDVAPILSQNCFTCHDSKKKKGKLDMTTFQSFRKGGTKDDPIEAGKPEESVLIEMLTTKGASRMPPKEAGEPLSKDKIAIISQWIKEGGKLDGSLTPKSDLVRELRMRFQPPPPPVAYEFPAKISAIAFTPDSKKVVVGGQHELTVWDVEQGKLEKRIHTRAECAYAMVFLPDGKLVVGGGRPGQEGDVRVYDLGGGTPRMVDGVAVLDGVKDKGVFLKELLQTEDSVKAVARSEDGKKLAAGGCDRLVRVWDISDGIRGAKIEQTIENHADWVFGVAFTADAKLLLTCGRDMTAKVWDLAAKESVMTFPDHKSIVWGVAITPDGKTGISAGEDNNVRFWQATDQAKQIGKQLKVGPGGHSKPITRLAFHSDPKSPIVATCSADSTVRLWNPNGSLMRSLTGHTDYLFTVALSADGKLVAAAGYTGEVRVWKTGDGELVRAFNASPGYQAKVEPKK
jgi:WD40 repeat protein